MTLFTSLGTSADCRGLAEVPKDQVRTCSGCVATCSFLRRLSSLVWGLQGKVARTPHQSKGGAGTVCAEHFSRICILDKPSPLIYLLIGAASEATFGDAKEKDDTIMQMILRCRITGHENPQ
jgi:hypothetical protein